MDVLYDTMSSMETYRKNIQTDITPLRSASHLAQIHHARTRFFLPIKSSGLSRLL